jgi:hypothetical protein
MYTVFHFLVKPIILNILYFRYRNYWTNHDDGCAVLRNLVVLISVNAIEFTVNGVAAGSLAAEAQSSIYGGEKSGSVFSDGLLISSGLSPDVPFIE